MSSLQENAPLLRRPAKSSRVVSAARVASAVALVLGVALAAFVATTRGATSIESSQVALGAERAPRVATLAAADGDDADAPTPAPSSDDANATAPAPSADDANTTALAPSADDANATAPAPSADDSADDANTTYVAADSSAADAEADKKAKFIKAAEEAATAANKHLEDILEKLTAAENKLSEKLTANTDLGGKIHDRTDFVQKALQKVEKLHHALEGSLANIDKDISDDQAKCYLHRYRDLRFTFGHNIARAKKHWVDHGRHEHRTLDCDYITNEEAQCYLNRYKDLRRAFGHNIGAAKRHWNKHGKKEGRDKECASHKQVKSSKAKFTKKIAAFKTRAADLKEKLKALEVRTADTQKQHDALQAKDEDAKKKVATAKKAVDETPATPPAEGASVACLDGKGTGVLRVMNDGGRLRQYASMANVHEWDPSGKITKIDCAPYDIITDPRLTSKAAYDAELKEKAEQAAIPPEGASVKCLAGVPPLTECAACKNTTIYRVIDDVGTLSAYDTPEIASSWGMEPVVKNDCSKYHINGTITETKEEHEAAAKAAADAAAAEAAAMQNQPTMDRIANLTTDIKKVGAKLNQTSLAEVKETLANTSAIVGTISSKQPEIAAAIEALKKKLSDSSLTIAEKKKLLEKNNVTIAALRAKIVELNATNAEEHATLQNTLANLSNMTSRAEAYKAKMDAMANETHVPVAVDMPAPPVPTSPVHDRALEEHDIAAMFEHELNEIIKHLDAQYNKTHDHDDDHDDHDDDHDGDHDGDHEHLAEHFFEPPLNHEVGDLPAGFPTAMEDHAGIQNGVAFIENCGVPQDIVDFLNKTDSNIEKLEEYFNDHPHYGTFDIAAMLREMETTWKEHGVCHLDDDDDDDHDGDQHDHYKYDPTGKIPKPDDPAQAAALREHILRT